MGLIGGAVILDLVVNRDTIGRGRDGGRYDHSVDHHRRFSILAGAGEIGARIIGKGIPWDRIDASRHQRRLPDGR